ncbi:MAG: hypothetical protein EPO68_14675 [Planctomycetota bacterium]|nr:MAG: hypothetical protein EPO68_14675 [Planctomycetota bacterium]
MLRPHSACPTACALALLVHVAAAQVPAQWNEPKSGVTADAGGWGKITDVQGVRVSSLAHWMQEVDTDHPNPAAQHTLMRSESLYLSYTNDLALPAGAKIGHFGAFDFNFASDIAICLGIYGEPPLAVSNGLYVGADLVLLEGWPVLAPPAPPGTTYRRFLDVRITDASLCLVRVDVAHPALPGVDVPALVTALPPYVGAGAQEKLVVHAGVVPPAQTEPIVDIAHGQSRLALNEANVPMFAVRLAGDPARDHAIYVGAQVVAQEGGASPVAGRAWADLSNAWFDLGDGGDWAVCGRLDGASADGELIARNGHKLVQSGDAVPSLAAPFALLEVGRGGVHIDEQGRVLWMGRWNDPDTGRDEGLFLDHELIVQEGVSEAFGVAIGALDHGADSIDLSPDGVYVAFKGVLPGVNGWTVFRRGPAAVLEVLGGCQPSGAALTSPTLFPKSGEVFNATLDGAQAAGAFGFLAYTHGALSSGPCGVAVPGLGELWIDPATLLLLQALGPWSGAPLVHPQPLPLAIELVGAQLWMQGAFVDVQGLAPNEPLRLSNALRLQLGWTN